ncbi:hypothetical protein [Pseudomonas shahriarae]
MSIPEKILQAGCDAYAATFLNGNGSLGDGIEAAYLAIHEHDDWVRAGPPAWTGEGLPPVGSGVCEYRGAHQWDEWTVVNIFASWGKGSSAVVFVDFGDGWREERDPERFRPIRTPEQIAEEARSAELNLMIGAIKDHPGGRHGVDHLTQLRIHEEACINLYDAGWRKQVAP